MAIIPYFCLALAAAAFDDFSGPQKGEPLPECSIKVIIGPDKGKTVKYKEPLGDKAAGTNLCSRDHTPIGWHVPICH